MKRKVTLVLIVVMLVSVVAFANSSSTSTIIAPTKPGQTQQFEPSFDRLASYMGYDTDEKFELFHKTAVFMGRYCTTQESFSYVEQMILSGCDAQTTMDIYQFYLTTNEPITIVRQIYDMVYTGEPITKRDAAFESAFNQITNNKCGVLTEADVISYLEKGLTVEDISQANLLSRRGVLTIQQILDSLLSDTGWESIIETISGESITLSGTTVASATRAMTISSVTDENLSTVLSSDNEEERISAVTKAVNTTLKEKGYWHGRKSDNFDKIALDAQEKGIPEAKLTELMNQGYSEVDLVNIINDPSCTPQSIDSIAKDEVTK